MTKRRLPFWCGLLSAWLLLAPACAWARDDFQTWETFELKKRLGPSWELFFRPEIRIRHDASQLFYHEYRQGVRWKSQHVVVGLNYLFVRNASTGKPREEHAGELDVTPKTSVSGLDLSLRWRLALRAIQRSAGEQEWQMRLMPKIACPTSLGGHKLTPYVADDLFYDYTRAAWNQNRLFLGTVFPLGKQAGADVSVDVYYMLQSVLGGRHDWSGNHVLGTACTLQW